MNSLESKLDRIELLLADLLAKFSANKDRIVIAKNPAGRPLKFQLSRLLEVLNSVPAEQNTATPVEVCNWYNDKSGVDEVVISTIHRGGARIPQGAGWEYSRGLFRRVV